MHHQSHPPQAERETTGPGCRPGKWKIQKNAQTRGLIEFPARTEGAERGTLVCRIGQPPPPPTWRVPHPPLVLAAAFCSRSRTRRRKLICAMTPECVHRSSECVLAYEPGEGFRTLTHTGKHLYARSLRTHIRLEELNTRLRKDTRGTRKNSTLIYTNVEMGVKRGGRSGFAEKLNGNGG